MRKAGVDDYEAFARKVLETITDRPISFEVFADEPAEMVRQARLIASLGRQRLREDPGHQHRGRPSDDVIRELSADGVQLNVTALMTVAQVETVAAALAGGPGHVVSVFAGRIADTGRDPMPIMAEALAALAAAARARAALGQPARGAQRPPGRARSACHIITVTPDLLAKLSIVRQGPRPVLAGDRADVPRRRRGGRLRAVSDAAARLNADGTDQDDWDDHWDTSTASSAKGNPANDYRHAMVAQAARRRPRRAAVLLDIGSGQGQFAVDLAATPTRGRRSSASSTAPRACVAPTQAAEREGAGATFFERNLLEPVPSADGQQPRPPTRSARRCSSTSTTRPR